MPKFQDYYPKTEYQRSDFLKNTSIIRNLIFAIQQVPIMQGLFNIQIDRYIHEKRRKLIIQTVTVRICRFMRTV
jgi:homoserine kinase